MHQNAPHLDGDYAAFGKLIEGEDVLDKIAGVDTDYSDRPRFLQSNQVQKIPVPYLLSFCDKLLQICVPHPAPL